MSLARVVVTSVLVEGRSKAAVARDYGLSRRWVHELVRRYHAEGEAGLEPRSRRPRASPHQIPEALEQQIVELRKQLAEDGLDAGAQTIAVHLHRRHGTSPAVSTIWRVLQRRGFVTPQPQKRPRSSFVRFQADQPNERWQADITHWALWDGSDVEVLNAIDDHSRLLVGSQARAVFKAADVVACLHTAAAAWGFPASMLTDNGAVFTAGPRGGGRCALEMELDSARDRRRALEPVPPADLRQGRALPPDAQAVARQTSAGGDACRAAGPARCLPDVLQRGPAAPGDRSADTGRGLRGAAHSDAARADGAGALPRPA